MTLSDDAGLPRSANEAAMLLADAALPEAILEVAQTLHAAGHEVVLVGGAVRDFLLRRAHGDWDLASAATPGGGDAPLP
jgi:hypothetical protein